LTAQVTIDDGLNYCVASNASCFDGFRGWGFRFLSWSGLVRFCLGTQVICWHWVEIDKRKAMSQKAESGGFVWLTVDWLLTDCWVNHASAVPSFSVYGYVCMYLEMRSYNMLGTYQDVKSFRVSLRWTVWPYPRGESTSKQANKQTNIYSNDPIAKSRGEKQM